MENTLPFVILLIGIMLITMLTRVFLPIGQKTEGTVIRQITLPFRYRLLYHRVSIYMIGLVMVLGGVGGWLSFAYQVVMMLGAFAICGIPIRYKFTAQQIALNNVVVRPWSEFEESMVQGRYLRLKVKNKGRDFKLLLPPLELEGADRLTQKLLKNGATSNLSEGAVIKTTPAKTAGFRPAKKARRAS